MPDTVELEIPSAVEATAKNGWTTFDRSMGGSDKDETRSSDHITAFRGAPV
jgi:hypothetical protein